MRFLISIGRMIILDVNIFEIVEPVVEIQPDVIVVHHHEDEDEEDGPGDLFSGNGK